MSFMNGLINGLGACRLCAQFPKAASGFSLIVLGAIAQPQALPVGYPLQPLAQPPPKNETP
jgi:hypothetical protein